MMLQHTFNHFAGGPPVSLREGDVLTAQSDGAGVELRVSYDAFTTSAPVSFAQPIAHAGAPADYRFVRVDGGVEPITVTMNVVVGGA